MAYDVDLAERIRAVLATEHGVTEKQMFGGLAFLVDARMAVAANRRGALMVRLDPQRDEPGDAGASSPVVMRGRPMPGWREVAADAVTEDDALREWVTRGVEFARSLPAKGARR